MKFNHLLFLILFCFTLQSCGITPTPYQRPELTLPAQWAHGQTTDQKNPSDIKLNAQEWWQHFSDEKLNQLIALLLQQNHDLAAAGIKIYRARLLAGLAEDPLINPKIKANANSSYTWYLRNQSVPTLESPTPDFVYESRDTSTASLSLGLNYELDLWGKIKYGLNAAQWAVMASKQDYAATRLSLIGTALKLYWQIAYLKKRLDLYQQDIEKAQKMLDLVRVQHQAGTLSSLEVLTAEQNLSMQKISYDQLIQQQVEAKNAFTLLFDGQLQQDLEQITLSNKPLPTLFAGLPAELLARRPDVHAAEMRLREALANIDIKRASFYPVFSLTSTLSSSGALRDALQNPLASLGAGLALPFLQWRELQLNLQISKADYQAAVISFKKTLYTALSEVDNALSARLRYQQQAIALNENWQNACALEALTQVRYQAGAIPLTDWLNSQEKRRTAENLLAENQLNQLNSQLTLYLALGGDYNQNALSLD